MLESIYIEKLFGLYTYTLDIKSKKGDSIQFITGPNGYGKTTILNILNNLYSLNFKALSEITFHVLKLSFDDSFVVEVLQERDSINKDEFSDEKASETVKLHIVFGKDEDTSSVIWDSDSNLTEGDDSSISLRFLASPIRYIRDNRLQDEKYLSQVTKCAMDLRSLLRNCLVKINDVLSIAPYPSIDSFGENEYNKLKENLKEDIDVLIFCGLLKNNPLPPYSEGNAGYLKIMAMKVRDFITNEQKFINQLKCFRHIIESSDFANKHLQISPQYGYRFWLEDENKTIILPEHLSSGEKHILIMSYVLIFDAAETSLVLLDEPELSFHLAWQMDFLKHLCEIVSLRNLQCIVCTHSPQMFGNKFHLAVDLYKQSHPSQSF